MKEKHKKLLMEESEEIEKKLDDIFEKIFNKTDFLWTSKNQKIKKNCKHRNNL